MEIFLKYNIVFIFLNDVDSVIAIDFIKKHMQLADIKRNLSDSKNDYFHKTIPKKIKALNLVLLLRLRPVFITFSC